jgi:hypothetical protein
MGRMPPGLTDEKAAWSAGISSLRSGRSCRVFLETIKRVEAMEGELKIRLDTLAKIRGALEKAGVEFIAENVGGAGVRLKKRTNKR